MALVMSAGASNTRCHFSDLSGWAFTVLGTSEFASEYNLSCNNAISMPNFFFFCLPLLLFCYFGSPSYEVPLPSNLGS